MKQLKNIVSKSSIKPELRCVKVTQEKMEATDSFKYVAIKNKDNIKEGYYDIKTGGYMEDINYPDVSVILNNLKNDLTVRVNRKYLLEVLQALGKGDTNDNVDISIDVAFAKTKPIHITNANGEALLMPIQK